MSSAQCCNLGRIEDTGIENGLIVMCDVQQNGWQAVYPKIVGTPTYPI
jgi:hypothetical protein